MQNFISYENARALFSKLMQKTVMPTASANNLNQIHHYTGTTNSTFINGYFYKCKSDGNTPPTYHWERVNVQPSNESSGSSDVVEGYYNSADGKFYEEDTYTTEIIGASNTIYVDINSGHLYWFDGTNYVCSDLLVFNGTTAEWNALTLVQKKTYDIVNILDDYESSSDISNKADKVINATTGDLASLDSSGNLADSGKKSSDFQTKNLETTLNIGGSNRTTVESSLNALNGWKVDYGNIAKKYFHYDDIPTPFADNEYYYYNNAIYRCDICHTEEPTDSISTSYFSFVNLGSEIADNNIYISHLDYTIAQEGLHNLIMYSTSATIGTGAETSGISGHINRDRSCVLSGTANNPNLSYAYVIAGYIPELTPGTYTLSGCPTGGNSSTYSLVIEFNDGNGTKTYYDIGNGKTFTVSSTIANPNIEIRIANGTTIENLEFKPVLLKLNSTPTIDSPNKLSAYEVLAFIKPIVAASTDFADFKARIAAM